MKKAKKGFTIVELVVVIAVIAILAAVLIPTFISIVNRAKVSNDNQLVRNLNTALITEEADGNKAENMSQAIAIAEDYGYKLENLQAKADGYVLLWNQTTNRFYVESAEGTITSNPEVTDFPAENYTYWEISKTLGTKHSTYLTEGSGNIAATNLGVDVSGISSAVNVTYTGNENKVIIATNGGDLSVNAENGHVAHYGFVKNLTVTAVNGADCYREHGYVGTLATFGTGKFVAEKGSQFHQTKIEVEGKVITPNTFVDLGATYGVHKRDENGICVICNDGGTPSAKNGLVDGYYYKDDVLYTGTETDNGTTYTFENGRLVVEGDISTQTSNDGYTKKSEVNYTIPNNDKYVTREIVLVKLGGVEEVFADEYSQPGYNAYAHITVTSNDSYSVKSINVSFDKDLRGAINYLVKSIRDDSISKGDILTTLSDNYNLDSNYLPLITASSDYCNYARQAGVEITSTTQNISEQDYEKIKEHAKTQTFGAYLRKIYGKEDILNISWDERDNYTKGNRLRLNSNNVVQDDPEIILLFLKNIYNNIFFNGLSVNESVMQKLAKDIASSNGNIYNYNTEGWADNVSSYYGLNIQSIFKVVRGQMDISELEGLPSINFYILSAIHGGFMSNEYMDRYFALPTYSIIIENTSYGA